MAQKIVFERVYTHTFVPFVRVRLELPLYLDKKLDRYRHHLASYEISHRHGAGYSEQESVRYRRTRHHMSKSSHNDPLLAACTD